MVETRSGNSQAGVVQKHSRESAGMPPHSSEPGTQPHPEQILASVEFQAVCAPGAGNEVVAVVVGIAVVQTGKQAAADRQFGTQPEPGAGYRVIPIDSVPPPPCPWPRPY